MTLPDCVCDLLSWTVPRAAGGKVIRNFYFKSLERVKSLNVNEIQAFLPTGEWAGRSDLGQEEYFGLALEDDFSNPSLPCCLSWADPKIKLLG